MPERIQLSRAKGWRMPPDTLKVDRTTKWGNPFAVGPGRTQEKCVDLYKKLLAGFIPLLATPDYKTLEAYLAFATANISELHGKNLACWCKLGTPCHADVLLEVAANERVSDAAIRRLWDEARGDTADGKCGWLQAQVFARLLTTTRKSEPDAVPTPAVKPPWPFPASAHEERTC